LFLKKKIHKRNDEHHAQQPAQQSVEPLPKIDVLEILEAEMVVEFLVFGKLFVMIELRDPLCLV